MRLFVGVRVPEIITKELSKIQVMLKQYSVDQSFPNEFHITLAFLGEVPEARVEKIKSQLKSLKFSYFTTNLTSIGCFPSTENPSVVWVGLEPRVVWQEFHKQIMRVLELPFEKEFVPHITLSRIKKPSEVMQLTLKNIVTPQLHFDVSEFLLMQSILGKLGARHIVLESVNLDRKLF